MSIAHKRPTIRKFHTCYAFLAVTQLVLSGMGHCGQWRASAGLAHLYTPTGATETFPDRIGTIAGFTHETPPGYTLALAYDPGINRLVQWVPRIGFATFALSKQGWTHILDAYSVEGQLRLRRAFAGRLALSAALGGGLHLFEDRWIDRNDASSSTRDWRWGLRWGVSASWRGYSIMAERSLVPAWDGTESIQWGSFKIARDFRL